MSTKVSDLFDMANAKYHLSLLGGKEGLTNSVSWVYLMEDVQNIPFLKGGELVITTGLFLQSGISLASFLVDLVSHHCSGLILNVGKYVHPSDLTPDIISYCNREGLPIFTLPWNVHLVDIMQDSSRLLLQDTQAEEKLTATFQTALYQSQVQENLLLTLNQYGFPANGTYHICIMHSLEHTTRIRFHLNRFLITYHLFQHRDHHILIYHGTPSSPSTEEIIHSLLHQKDIKIGMSASFTSLVSLSNHYKEACFCLTAAEFWNRTYVAFDELSFMKILFHTSEPTVLKSIYLLKLGPFEEYDTTHGSDYCNTLWNYLKSDCNLLITASVMHTHRNTIIYRINKIKELFHIDFNDVTMKFDLQMAFIIKEYLKIIASAH